MQSVIILSASEESDAVPVKKKMSTEKVKTAQKSKYWDKTKLEAKVTFCQLEGPQTQSQIHLPCCQ